MASMRLLGILASLLALVFYLVKIFRFFSGRKPQTNRPETDSIDSRLKRAKQADVIEVKTVSSSGPDATN
jgi:hypothetical protein